MGSVIVRKLMVGGKEFCCVGVGKCEFVKYLDWLWIYYKYDLFVMWLVWIGFFFYKLNYNVYENLLVEENFFVFESLF